MSEQLTAASKPHLPGAHVRKHYLTMGANLERDGMIHQLNLLLEYCNVDPYSAGEDKAYDEGYREAVKWIRNLLEHRRDGKPYKPAHNEKPAYTDADGGYLDMAYEYTCNLCSCRYTLTSNPAGNGYKCGTCDAKPYECNEGVNSDPRDPRQCDPTSICAGTNLCVVCCGCADEHPDTTNTLKGNN